MWVKKLALQSLARSTSASFPRIYLERLTPPRAEWKVMQLELDPSYLIFIDQTWIKTNMTRIHEPVLSANHPLA
jgi:hypothetical protein